MPKALPGYSGGRLPGRSTKDRDEIIEAGAENKEHRTGGQGLMRSLEEIMEKEGWKEAP